MVDNYGNKIAVNQNFNIYGQETPDFKEASDARKVGLHQSIALGIYDFINSDIISEGGDKEFNGAGILMTIEDTEVKKCNPQYTKEEIEAEYKKIFNLKKIIWLPYSTFEDEEIYDEPLDIIDGKAVYRSLSTNGHIDEMARFVEKNKILLAEVAEEEVSRFESMRITKERLEKAYEILKEETDADGEPFEIIRIPVPEPMEVTAKRGDYIYDLWMNYKEVEGISDTLRDGSLFPCGEELQLCAAASYAF